MPGRIHARVGKEKGNGVSEPRHGTKDGGGPSKWAKEIFREDSGSLQGNSDLRRCPSSRGQSGLEPVAGTELGMWDSGKKASF